MWTYRNPVDIRFGAGVFDGLSELIGSRRYVLVTYGEPIFEELVARLVRRSGLPTLLINDVEPNPDFVRLAEQSAHLSAASDKPEIIVALGGGSVIDSAKVLAAGANGFERVETYLRTGQGSEHLSHIPIIAVPTTAGTGSEVTCWGTVWDRNSGRKFSLAYPRLYPVHAVVDPVLTLGKPRGLTISTGLDALSHAFESIWNTNANPVSTDNAICAAREIMATLPDLVDALDEIGLRERMAKAALQAGLAFSNTKTAIAHSISYTVTLRYGVPHGIACSFTLPAITRSLIGRDGDHQRSLRAILGDDLLAGADRLERFLEDLGVATDPSAYGIGEAEWRDLIVAGQTGERGQNFIGEIEALLVASGMPNEVADLSRDTFSSSRPQ